MSTLLKTINGAIEALEIACKYASDCEPDIPFHTGEAALADLRTLVTVIESRKPFAWYHNTFQGEVKFTTQKPSWPESVWPPIYTAPQFTEVTKAIMYYEAALKAAFPRGASGIVFEHWNEARKSLAVKPPECES